MDVEKLFMKIESLDDYINATKDVSKKYKNSKVQFNMSTLLSLKKARSLEIEYFNKCEGHGAAIIIIERVLEVARSKTWGLLGKELVWLVQHWLDATRKHLVIQNTNWWSFMNLLLKFIKELRLKDPTLPDILVESTSEHLLDLATRIEPNVSQRLAILYVLNLCCADSSREVRFATRHQLENYFVKLSSLLATSGHAPTQYYMLETLLRWLLPRQNTSVRLAAAAKWFPDTLYSKETVDIFLERPWQNFFQDARDFLNAHNRTQGVVTSAIYHQITIGAVTIECSSRRDAWLDINPADKSITILLEPHMMETLAVTAATLQILVIDYDSVVKLQLCRNAPEVTISMKTSRPTHVYPSEHTVGDGGDITIVVSTRNDLRRLDRALADIFGEKYEALIDFETVTSASPRDRNKRIVSSSEEDTRFSHPVRPTRRKASGYVVKSASTWKSPSTTSTTSLALLHDRLEALPKFKYNKEPVKVLALPDLSIVSELTEINDSQSIASGTGKRNYRPYRLGIKSFRQSEKKSQSDGEKRKSSKKNISPVVGANEPSCLLVATVGSDESVINDTIECLSKNKDYTTDNIVDLLLQEALRSKDEKLDSGTNTGENKKSQDLRESDAIEDTPNLELNITLRTKKINNVDQFNTPGECSEINETQFEYVSVRKKVIIDKHKEIENDIQKGIDANDMHTFDEVAVEKFFSEHIADDRSGGIVVSPTLARKINETSSETSDHFEDCLVEENVLGHNEQDVEIIDCVNSIIDKVCYEFEKCAEILEKDNFGKDILKIADIKEAALKDNVPSRVLTNIENLDSGNKKDTETPKKKSKPKKPIKIKFKTKKNLNKTRLQKQNKLDSARKMSPIPENKDSVEPEIPAEDVNRPHGAEKKSNNLDVNKEEVKHTEITEVPLNEMASPEIREVSPKSDDLNTPLIRSRRRKLYSPKDEHENIDIQNEDTQKKQSEVHCLHKDDSADFKPQSKKNPKYAATCYKDIEKERKKNIRLPRSRKSKAAQARSPSPRTKKMNELFDNLKTNLETHEDVVLADKTFIEKELAVFNFTSDSEDEDFKKKKIEIKKRISTTTNASGDSTVSKHGRHINKVNYSEKSSDEKTKKTKARNVVRRKKSGQRRPHNLADEKMRDAKQDDLNSSLVLLKNDEVLKDPDLILEAPPQMERIGSEIDKPVKVISRSKRTVKKKKKVESTETVTSKKEKGKTKLHIDNKIDNDDRTLSPLPGLVIERMPKRKEDPNDSVTTQIMNKLKNIYTDGPDAVDESNTTQNMLLDLEKNDYNPHFNISNELAKMCHVAPNVIENENSVFNDKENILEVNSFEENPRKTNDKTANKIENVSIFDEQSEKSIATVGKFPITAHGDIDEEPPDNRQLNKRVQSRNLGIEDMDTSIKDYYFKLREEINKPENSRSSNSSKHDNVLTKKKIKSCLQQYISPVRKMSNNNAKRLPTNCDSVDHKLVENISENVSQKCISPVVSLYKMSYDDISKWLPTRSDLDKPKIDLVEKTSDSGSRQCISPVVSLDKLSYDDISRWLPSRRNSDDSSAHSKKSVIIEKFKNKNEDIPEKNIFLRPMSNVNAKNAPCEELRSDKSNVSRKRTEDTTSNKQTVNEKISTGKKNIKQHDIQSATKSISSIKRIEMDILDCNNNDHNSMAKRKTLISPIKLFEDLENDVISLATEKESKLQKNENIEIKSPVLNISSSKDKRYDLRKSTLVISSCESKISSSTRVDGKQSMRSTFKRKSDSPVKAYGKKRVVEVLTESGPSVSSIDDWFKKSAPISAAESLSASYSDSLQNIMEKLDTTLAEIHQNTSRNFLHMFVEAQRQLSEAKNERRRALKQVASDVLKDVVAILDTKFADLEKRTQELDTEFMEQLKSRATEFIREDCKKKRVMVTLLQEDVKAVVNRVHRESQ